MVGFNRAVHDREAKSGTTGFRGDERLEQSLPYRLRDSPSLIGDLQHHRAARETLGLSRQLMMPELRCLEPDFATRRRCLHCVEEEIEDRAV